jgi:hypothetical protein
MDIWNFAVVRYDNRDSGDLQGVEIRAYTSALRYTSPFMSCLFPPEFQMSWARQR